VFVRPELVIEPGMAQIGAALLIFTATIGITFSLQARFSESRAADLAIRLVLAAFALVVLLYPEVRIAIAACVPVLLLIAYWLVKRRTVPFGDEAAEEPVLAPVPVPIVDTERGRMQ
jgi:hypothetical protein